MDIQVFNVLDPKNSIWREKFELYLEHIQNHYDHKLIGNYTPDRFPLNKQLGVFLTVDVETDDIIRFETVFRADIWPQRVVRLFNRTWLDPKYRGKGMTISRKKLSNSSSPTDNMYSYSQQIKLAQEIGASCLIMTRQVDETGSDKIGLYADLVNRFHSGWTVSKNRFYLTHNRAACSSCWQRVVSLPLNPNGRDELDKMIFISDAEYEHKFGRKIRSYL